MINLEMHEASEDFALCWQAAGRHVLSCAKDVELSWLKSTLSPPYLEHLSFRIANQLFFIRIIDEDHNLDLPGNKNGFKTIAEGCNGNACILPMIKENNSWKAVHPGWGLINPETKNPINPVELISDEKIEITDWELHDFAVQIVRDHVEKKLGFQIMSSHSNPSINPSLWFVGESGPEYVIVRGIRYPETEANIPSNINEIAANCAHESKIGHFAAVSFANAEDPFDSSGKISPLPIWRGYGCTMKFDGLISLQKH